MVNKMWYSEETKKEVLGRVTGPEKESVINVAIEKKINKATIYKWIKEAEEKESQGNSRLRGNWTSEDKFHMVLETASLTEQELSK